MMSYKQRVIDVSKHEEELKNERDIETLLDSTHPASVISGMALGFNDAVNKDYGRLAESIFLFGPTIGQAIHYGFEGYKEARHGDFKKGLIQDIGINPDGPSAKKKMTQKNSYGAKVAKGAFKGAGIGALETVAGYGLGYASGFILKNIVG